MNRYMREWLDNGADIEAYIEYASNQALAQGGVPRSREDYAEDAWMFVDASDRAIVERSLAEWRAAELEY